MICYTRNFEDVILQRVFSDVADGCYVDVGASAPVDDSNTFALYQKGWRGVAIEPLPYYQHLWQQLRPGDVSLNVAIGEQTGQLSLQVFEESLLFASGSADTLSYWQEQGIQPARTVQVPVLTLNQVIAQYLPQRPLHLLSIDVEGMEHQVLRGLDLHLHRPWVVVLEAVLPGCQTPAHHAWEPYLLSANYWMAYFDGVNRFYLAQEQRHLLGRFALPPNVWDSFVMETEYQLQAKVARLEAEVAHLKARLGSPSGAN